jgi:hypothetical protein
MLSRYTGSWFYDLLSETDRLFGGMFADLAWREEELGDYPPRKFHYGTFRSSLQLPQDVAESILEVTVQGGPLTRSGHRGGEAE